jgi:hypothetical protein
MKIRNEKKMGNLNLLKPVNDLANINLKEMAPVATNHFCLAFQPPCRVFLSVSSISFNVRRT